MIFRVLSDLQGRIGAYWHGNEPCHQILYFYNYLKQPWKCQEKLRYIMDTFYGNTPGSLSGNDDCGQMSAWYIFNTMGFYPTAHQVMYIIWDLRGYRR